MERVLETRLHWLEGPSDFRGLALLIIQKAGLRDCFALSVSLLIGTAKSLRGIMNS